jgi:phenylalanyl-tRNA synthetase alpha chain
MDIQKLVDTLHPLERTVLPFIKAHASVDDLMKASKLKEVEVMRALQWLQNKGVVTLDVHESDIVRLDVNGQRYLKQGLPERRFLAALADKPLPLPRLISKADLSKEEANICIGLLRQKGAIILSKEKDLVVSLTPQGAKLRDAALPEEDFLKTEFPRQVDALPEPEKRLLQQMRSRKQLVVVEKIKSRSVRLTPLGQTLVERGVGDGKVIDALTPDMLRSGDWKQKRFRRYDLTAHVPRINGGRRHFVEEGISYIRRIWMDMGFTEMTGTLVQPAFWNLDVLFVPQDHPARDMQDTFFVEGKATIPADVAKRVKAAHEKGVGGGSGWGGEWTDDIAKQLVLRTHNTVLSARTIAALKDAPLPAKFFAVGRVFRNEALDWKHLFEFHQFEGIVVDPDANLRHLMFYLKEFYSKMGYSEVRLAPSFFPYTEPSFEVSVFHPVRKEWVELGGAGILRPEVVVPLLGKDVPVLAWGQGLERVITDYYKMNLPDMYSNDIEQLRTIKAWLR